MRELGTWSDLFHVFKQALADWSADRAPRLGAALAYYTVFSIAPLLVIVIAVAGLALGRQAAQGTVVDQIQSFVGPETARGIQSLLENARKPATGAAATLMGLASLLLGATGVVSELQSSLDLIWRVEAPRRGLKAVLKDRLLAFACVLSMGFVLLVSLVISAAVAAMGKFFSVFLPSPEWVLQLLNFGASFAVTAGLFALIYKLLPHTRVAWRDVWFGACLTSLLFSLGKSLLGLYLGKSTVSAYGAAGSLVLILLWAYYSAQILYFGAEFTHVFAHRHGSRSHVR